MLTLIAGIMPLFAMSNATAAVNNTPAPAVASASTQPSSVSVQNVHGTYEGKSAMHNVNGKGFFLTADFIYWEASVDNLSYATRITEDDTVYQNKQLAFQWDPGFKVGAGYTFCHDDWDLYANWTHLNSKAQGSTKATQTNDQITPILASDIFGGSSTTNSNPGGTSSTNYRKAHSRWLLFYNTVDLELGRNYFNSKALSFRPHFGARAAWIDQHISAKYSDARPGGSFIGQVVTPPETFKSSFNYDGYGLRAGIDALFHFSSCWGIFAKAAGSLLYGQVHIRTRAAIPESTGTPGAVDVLVNKKNISNFWRGRVNLEGALGIEWETFFHDKESHLAFSLGYEFNQWFRLNTISPANGDLFLQGLTFSARYDF